MTIRQGGPPTMGQDQPWSPYDGDIRPHPGPRRPMPYGGPLPPRPGSPKPPLNPRPTTPPPRPQPPNPQPGPNPFPQPPSPQPPGVPPTSGPPGTFDPYPPTRPTTPTMPMGGGSQSTSLPVTGGGGFGGGYGGGPSSPVTPNISDQSRPNDNFTGGYGTGGGGGYGTGGGQRTFGTGQITNKNIWNVAGDTSVTEGDELAQKMPKKTFKPPKVAMGQKMIGDPKMAMQQLSAMNQTPFMRRA